MTKQNTAQETVTEEIITENNCDVDKTKEELSNLYKNVTMAQNCVKTLLPYVEKQEITKVLH